MAVRLGRNGEAIHRIQRPSQTEALRTDFTNQRSSQCIFLAILNLSLKATVIHQVVPGIALGALNSLAGHFIIGLTVSNALQCADSLNWKMFGVTLFAVKLIEADETGG